MAAEGPGVRLEADHLCYFYAHGLPCELQGGLVHGHTVSECVGVGVCVGWCMGVGAGVGAGVRVRVWVRGWVRQITSN